MAKRAWYLKCLFWPFPSASLLIVKFLGLRQEGTSTLLDSVTHWLTVLFFVLNPNTPRCGCSNPLISDQTVYCPAFVSCSGLPSSSTCGHPVNVLFFLATQRGGCIFRAGGPLLTFSGKQELSCRLPYLGINIGVQPSHALSCNSLHFSQPLSISPILRFPPTHVWSAGILC